MVSGDIMLFTQAIENGKPGARTHFMGVAQGECFFGFDLQRYDVGSGFLAVARQGTSLRKLSLNELQDWRRTLLKRRPWRFWSIRG